MDNNIQEAYCSFEVSKMLKEKGFDVKCSYWYTDRWNDKPVHGLNESNGFYEGGYAAPTHALAIEWLRVNFGVWIEITETDLFNKFFFQMKRKDGTVLKDGDFDTPQEVTEAALKYVLKELIN